MKGVPQVVVLSVSSIEFRQPPARSPARRLLKRGRRLKRCQFQVKYKFLMVNHLKVRDLQKQVEDQRRLQANRLSCIHTVQSYS